MIRFIRCALRLFPTLVILSLPLGVSWGQTPEVEPNDSCQEAQLLGGHPMPIMVVGELSLPPSVADIDFLTFVGPPDTLVQIDLRGAATGGGTLGDPFLGVLDASCNLLGMDDDGGISTDSRVAVTIPSDGVLVLAASSCCDWGLTGEGGSRGSYTIIADVPHVIGSIRVRLVDAETGAPLVGWWPTNARAELWRCNDNECSDLVNTQWTDGDGQIFFTSDYGGVLLQPAKYEVRAWAEAYEPIGTGLFEVGENEHVDLGDVALVPYDLIGSISGRIVDGISGTGLSGTMTPWAMVQLIRCSEWGCWDYVGSTNADHEGYFRFDYSNTWAPLLTSDYRLLSWADQYQTREAFVAAVAEDEERDVGRVRLRPFPVQFVEFTPCYDIPAAGGSCEFSVVVRAGTRSRLDAEAWSIVSVHGTGSFVNSTLFQAGGTKSGFAVPEKFKLLPGESKRVHFRFEVPGSVQAGAWICASAYVGERPDPHYSTLGFRDLFCVTKQWASFELVPEKEMRKRLDRQR